MDENWKLLAERAVRRRAELGLSQVEVAQRGPLSLDRLQNIEGAKRTRYRLSTLLALERALDWASGSVEAVLAGGEPTVTDRSTGARGNDAEEEDQFAKMDRLYEEWKQDPERRQALWTILRTGEEKDAG